MSEEQLTEYERWAQAWSRLESPGSRRVLELVAEVRRLRSEAHSLRLWQRVGAIAPEPPAVDEAFWLGDQPAPVPPFPGILAGITAADVCGVQV